MNYEQLASFVAFAEHVNFTRAAKQLHISQPALHVQIRKLADAVGRPLYRRQGRALVLTPEGERLAAYGREIAERGNAVLAEVRGEQVAGPVVLAAGQGAFRYLLGDAIRQFPKPRENTPREKAETATSTSGRWPLRLLAMSGPDAIAAVRSSRVHVAVAATNDPPDDLETRRIRVVKQHVVMPSAHRLATRRSIKPRDLEGEPIICAPAGSPHRTMLAQTLGDFEVAVEATGWELMLHFARVGMGLAIVNDFCEAPRGCASVPLEGAPSIAYYAITRGGKPPAGVARLIELVSQA